MNPYSYICDIEKKKVTAAQNALQKALIKSLETKEIYQITISELCEKACVARSTFYAYYGNVCDCLSEIENNLIYDIVKLNDELKQDFDIEKLDLNFYSKTLQYIKENQKLFYLLLVKRASYDFIEKWKDGIKYHLYDKFSYKTDEKNKELTLEIIACEAIAAYSYWVKNPYEIDFEYVKKLIKATIKAYTTQYG